MEAVRSCHSSRYILMIQMVFTLAWVKLLCSSPTEERCPAPCLCSAAENDQVFVDCSEQNMSEIPNEFPPKTVEISLNHNSFMSLQLVSFPSLASLKKLSLQSCNIKYINDDEEALKAIGAQYLNLPQLQVLDLMHNELHSIPSKLPKSLHILHIGSNLIDSIDGDHLVHLTHLRELFLDNNVISWLDWQSFHNSTYASSNQRQEANEEGNILTSLEKLALNSNMISSISKSAFTGMSSLTALTLSKNKLTTLNEKTFKDLKRLQHLDLSYNRITEIPAHTFEGVRFLKYLNLNHNRIEDVPSSLPMLEWLDLSHNRIANVSEDLKPVIFPAEVFNFAHNPLHCDCKILWLKELYDRREYLLKHIDISSEEFVPSCVSPRRLAGESWDNLADNVFTCQEDPEDPTIYDDPLQPRSKSQIDRLRIKSGAISDKSIQVFWSHQPPTSYVNVFIQSYVFGLRSTTAKHVELSAAQQEYTLRHMRSQTNYVVCVIPKMSDSDENLQPFSLDHCLEVQTKLPVEEVENVSYMSVVTWYILGMLGTVISIFSCVGGVALVYGLYSSKTDWSAKYAQEIQVDAPVDDSTVLPPPYSGGDMQNSPPNNPGKDKTD